MANVKYNFRSLEVGQSMIVDYRGRNAAYVFAYYNKDYRFKTVVDGGKFLLTRVR
jgi:hypothetical protein